MSVDTATPLELYLLSVDTGTPLVHQVEEWEVGWKRVQAACNVLFHPCIVCTTITSASHPPGQEAQKRSAN